MFKLCTNKNHSYKHNEQISKQNIDNSERCGAKCTNQLSIEPPSPSSKKMNLTYENTDQKYWRMPICKKIPI
jgi:hypothetical protein